jgi:hypothetical protein
MISWIVTSILIAAFSAAALKLFGEESAERPAAPKLAAGLPHGLSQTVSGGFSWEQMTDLELDALMAEFSAGDAAAAPTKR